MSRSAVVAVYAIAMVSGFPYAKLARVLRLPLWLWVLPAICALISVPGTFAAVVGGYLVSGPLLWLVSAAGPRSPTRPSPSDTARDSSRRRALRAATCARSDLDRRRRPGQVQRAMTVSPPMTRSPGPTSAVARSAGR